MDEPFLYNHSEHLAEVLPILDREGAQARLVIVKASYAIAPGGALRRAETPRAIRLGDVHWGPPEIADLRLPGDFGLTKPGTDFVLSGHAVPPPGTAPHMDVGIRIADRLKVMRVHGHRLWRRGLTGVVPGPSEPVVRTPLAWSRAYGGSDFSDPAHPVEDAKNPVGSGVARRPDRLIGQPAPQIESPMDPVTAAGGRHVPIGCAPLGRHFEPRRRAAGTHDEAWLRTGYPARPRDYRDVHEHCASPDLVFDSALLGGEPVRLAGVHEGGLLEFELPKWRLRIDATIDGKVDERRPHLDTVVVDTDAMVVELVWRSLFRCPARMRDRFTQVKVVAKEVES